MRAANFARTGFPIWDPILSQRTREGGSGSAHIPTNMLILNYIFCETMKLTRLN